jgi:hypothetical protein
MDEGFLRRSPARKLEVPKAQKSRVRLYSLVEVRAFFIGVDRTGESLFSAFSYSADCARPNCSPCESKMSRPIGCVLMKP